MVNNGEQNDEMVVVLPQRDQQSPASSEPVSADTLDRIKCEDIDDESRLSPTSLYCSLPLNRDVQSIIDTFPKTDVEKKKVPRKLPCLYCERTFVADNLRAKHVERSHSIKQARRSSSRFQQNAPIPALPVTTCQFCTKFAASECGSGLDELFRHLVAEHFDRYFACVPCKERFVSKMHLDEHTQVTHYDAKRDCKSVTPTSEFASSSECDIKVEQEDVAMEDEESPQKELRSKRVAIKSTKLGIKRSARLQNKEPSVSSAKTISKKKPAKSRVTIEDPLGEREIVKVSPHENPYPTFDAFYRVKKITDHSIDNLRITSLTFNDVFDQAFFTRIKCNIRDNLLNHIDGKLFKNEESESRISNFEKNVQPEVPSTENNYGCELSLNAATPVASLVVPQPLCDDPEAQIEYGSKASKKKTSVKQDEVHYKYFTRRKYQASILESKENRDLSKLDMWTQVLVKRRQQAVQNKTKTDKEIQEYKRGVEYKDNILVEELNKILDRRGPFEDLKEEATKKAALEGNFNREAHVEAAAALEDILESVFSMSPLPAETKTELTDSEIPAYLNLRKASLTNESHIDRSDKITLICSSEETENFEAPQVPPRDKNSLVELTGEWTRSRIYICAACGLKEANMRSLMDHKNVIHQNVWCHHYEFVGNQGAFYRNLSIPGLGKMEVIETNPLCKMWQRSDARLCTKCKKQCNTLGELHRHILECGEDWSWMLARKKCKYRPFGSKSRRKRKGLLKRIINKEKSSSENREKKPYKREGPRVKPSDAETIERMLSNLPAKRATRKIMSLKDGFPSKKTASAAGNKASNKAKAAETTSAATAKATPEKQRSNVIVAGNKCNPVATVRKSVRNLNKVISSALIDNNLVMKRKVKSIRENLRNDASVMPPPELPLAEPDLTDEQKALEVKKKINLLKKVQNLRKSVIKKRTTDKELESQVATTVTTRSGASATAAPTAKPKRSSIASKLIKGFSGRNKSDKVQTDASSVDNLQDGLSSENTDKATVISNKRKSSTAFGTIKKALKKIKVSHKKPKVVAEDKASISEEKSLEPTNVPSSTDYFLEESSQESHTRTIGNCSETKDATDSASCEIAHQSNIEVRDSEVVKELIEETKKDIIENTEIIPEVKPPVEIAAPITNKPKGKLFKRTKGLNDCIAMLTSKLIGYKTEEVVPTIKEVEPVMPAEPLMTTIAPPLLDDTLSTEEQNVVIPEETVNDSLESAKEPEECCMIIEKPEIDTLTDATLITPVLHDKVIESKLEASVTKVEETLVEQEEKENMLAEQQKPQAPQKNMFGDVDLRLDKVEDILKCIEDMGAKDKINGHLDNTISSIVGFNYVKDNRADVARRTRRGASKKTRDKLNNALVVAAEETAESIVSHKKTRKIGARRRVPRKSKLDKSEAAQNGPIIADKLITEAPEKKVINLSTIVEEDSVKTVGDAENCPIEVNQEEIVNEITETKAESPKATPLFFNLQPENETDVMECKNIMPDVAASDSEDELPLSKLIQSKTPVIGTAENDFTMKTNDGIIEPVESLEIIPNGAPVALESDKIIPDKVEVHSETAPLAQEVATELMKTPKIRKKPGRKSRKKQPNEITTELPAESVEKTDNDDNNEINNDVVPEESPSLPTKRRKRKTKKSFELNTTTPEALTTPLETLESNKEPIAINKEEVSENKKEQITIAEKSLAIYDFDEESDSLGDNSKENIIVKQFTPKKSKRATGRNREAQSKQSDDVVEMESSVDHQNVAATPFKDHKNTEDSFIQPPDLDNSSIEKQIVQNLKLKRGQKSRKAKELPVEETGNNYCEICNKHFVRADNLVKHKRTLTHIAKLSEIEALESQAKKAEQKEEEDVVQKSESDLIFDQLKNEEKTQTVAERPQTPEAVVVSEQSISQQVLVKSPFSINTNNDTLKLVDIISDVLNKPVNEAENKYASSEIMQSPARVVETQAEPKRYKSLGERKSFDSDSSRIFGQATGPPPPVNYAHQTHISPPHLMMPSKDPDAYVKEQISLLENILVLQDQKAQNSLDGDDDLDKSLDPVDSFEEDNFDEDARCPSDMSLVSDIKAEDSRIISRITETARLEENFLKPNQFDEISEDSLNNRVHDERTRKTLNRDEELFLECCSLLKSSSEVSNFSKKSFNAKLIGNHYGNMKSLQTDTFEPMENECTNYKISENSAFADDNSFMSDSCPNTPIGNSYEEFSNSNSVRSDWSGKSTGEDMLNFKNYETARGKLELMSSEVEENSINSNDDFTRKFDAKFGGLMVEALKSKPKKNKTKKKNDKSEHIQTAITDYTTRLVKSPDDSATNDSKKMPVTKGAMKVFEGLKVSIPTDDLDMNQVLNCSPTSKRLELELKNQVGIKEKSKANSAAHFGNKLGMKVTKKPKNKTSHHKKVSVGPTIANSLLMEDKIPDVYDFEETQDNTDLYAPNKLKSFVNKAAKKSKITPAKKDTESDTDSNIQFGDSFNENQSVSSSRSTTETESSVSTIKKPVDNDAITKKKCKIMGRIFKNAFKAKIDDEIDAPVKETPAAVEEPLENAIIDSEEIAAKPITQDRPKMTEKEMDLLFDKLLEDAGYFKRTAVGSDEHNETEAKNEINNCDAGKNTASKSITQMRRKKRVRKNQNDSDCSDDEFNLGTKTPKKRTARKPKDNGSINLEQELKECMGVAGRKSQRKCTSGKQNVLIEDWSSDDSEFEAMCRLSLEQHYANTNSKKSKEGRKPDVAENNVPTESSPKDTNESKPAEIEKPKVQKKAKRPMKIANNNKNKSNPLKETTSKSNDVVPTVATNRRKRSAGDTLYYWSSSSDDEDAGNLIEVKNVREDEYLLDDQEDRPTQHGWIVGDSPKKLVTMLAQAKGKKQVDGKCVKEQGKKRSTM